MPTATLTRKGQITIPLAVRTALGLHAGTNSSAQPGAAMIARWRRLLSGHNPIKQMG